MKKILINLKDWFNLEENKQFVSKVDGLPVVVFPALPYLYLYKDSKTMEIGIQDIMRSGIGPHTGCVSFEHLKDFNVTFAIINHREKKVSDLNVLREKIVLAISNNISAIICFDGTKEFEEIIDTISKISFNHNLYLAYEPSIEKDKEDIKKEIISFKRDIIAKVKRDIHLVYGGSISKENIRFYNDIAELAGFLISRNALRPNDLKEMLDLIKLER